MHIFAAISKLRDILNLKASYWYMA